MRQDVYSRKELTRIMRRFIRDRNRGISLEMFAELCGYSLGHLRDVFVYMRFGITDTMQIRVSRAFNTVKDGYAKTMEFENKRYVEYRKVPKPVLKRETRLVFDGNEFKMHSAVRNKFDYSIPTLEEQLEYKYGSRA